MPRPSQPRHRRRSLPRVNLLLLLAALLALAPLDGCSSARATPNPRKLIVIGIDAMDPVLLKRYMADGQMPNFKKLMEMGGFHKLRTSIPPQTPVAFSNAITGMNPGGHGIFDFIHRDPQTMLPYLSTSIVVPPKHTLTLGDWVIPLSSGHAELLRHGEAFWQILERHGIPSTVYRIPSNFPPAPTKAKTFSGMGVPDMLGTYGTYSFYTSDPLEQAGQRSGGRVFFVRVKDSSVTAKLPGPVNTYRKSDPETALGFQVWLDPNSDVARIDIQGNQIFLQQGEWSHWVQLKFSLVPGLASTTAICKFYLKQVHPLFKLYVSPLNIDPSDPSLPLSTPAGYSEQLWKALGFFYTQGIPEDTKALTDGVFSDADFLSQSKIVLREDLRAFHYELRHFHSGMLFFYFSSLDLNAHMFWRTFDKNSPDYDPETAAKYGGVLEWFYHQIDGAIGAVLPRLDTDTTLIVFSDHGFAPFDRAFNLNYWLLQNGYLVLKPGVNPATANIFTDADWSRTRAYALGLNGLYLNLQGREEHGIVHPGAQAEHLKDEMIRKLLAIRDPKTGLAPILQVFKAEDVYTGPYVKDAPDMIMGYNRRYRAGWKTVLGEFASSVLEDNIDPWSGDHCIDYHLVPGVLLSNQKITSDSPALTDIAPTILHEFGIAAPKNMIGHPVLAPAGARVHLAKKGSDRVRKPNQAGS